MALVAFAEVRDDVVGPLVRLCQQHAVGVALVHLGAHALQEGVRLGEVLAVRPVALVEVRHGVEPEAVEAEVEPEAQHIEHLVLHRRVVVVQVGLVGEEPVPVVLAAGRVPGPVRRLGVDEDHARLTPALVVVGPDIPVAVGAGGFVAARLEPGMVRRGVVHDQVGDHAQAALVRLVDERAEVLDRPVVGMHAVEVGDVVAAVAQRARVHGQQPDAVDAEPLQVVELVDQAPEVAGAVVVRVEEPAQVDLVEDRGLEPERIPLEPVRRLWRRHGRITSGGSHRHESVTARPVLPAQGVSSRWQPPLRECHATSTLSRWLSPGSSRT